MNKRKHKKQVWGNPDWNNFDFGGDQQLASVFGAAGITARYPTTFSLDAVLNDSPHYSDKAFDKEQTIFGKEQKGLSYNYSDRLWQADYNKAEDAAKQVNAKKITHRALASRIFATLL